MSFVDKFQKESDQIKRDIDQLFDFYDKYKPQASRELKVNCTAENLSAFALVVSANEFIYRDRVLIPTKVDMPSVRRYNSLNQSDMEAATTQRNGTP